MAPPRNTSPPTSASKNATSSKKSNKVTPAQVAFLVERYLADNAFSASLAAFRSDAAHLFTKAAPVPPKGLLPLADILHDYVALKEARLSVDSAMHAMHNLVSAYYLHHPPPTTPGTLRPSSPAPLFAAASSSPPPPGPAGYASPMIHYTQTSSSVVVKNASEPNNTSPPAASVPAKKRKATKSAGKTTSASKKACTIPTTISHPKACQMPIGNPAQNIYPAAAAAAAAAALPASAEHSVVLKLPVQGSTVAKSLFKPLQSQAHASPCTPQQSHPVQDGPAAYQTEKPSSVVANPHAQQELASSQCSIVSSKTLIVSPLKGAAYYAVERSYHVSSPMKSSVQKSSKREHVKGKLDFSSSDVRPCTDEQICDKASTSTSTSSQEDKQDDFDIDFTNFDIFDGDFSFSEFLIDFDLDTEGIHCHSTTSMNDEVRRLDPVAKSDYITAAPVLPGSVKPVVAGPTEDIDSQGSELTLIISCKALLLSIFVIFRLTYLH
ncbi:hypothetical protein GUJ93_ZPchr0007g3119 [Zizania palustris]|uniref:Uncharacterized protein n=1 Tax=Zizania palustris TaxID=103762 RepID=A0A8J5W5F9_ZIZPA|nr:hypothetical protein GUJ93_ZPchr0007g3119 [Zizania palustris]